MATDPAFLFYPADVAEDTLMMNRLQRGCYFDILKAQKRFEQFTIEQLKEMLGADFESCWHALKPVLKQDGPYYYINWVREAIKKRKEYSESRRANRKKSYDEDVNNTSKTYESDKENISNSYKKDVNNICETHVEHMENENGIENKNKTTNEKKGVEGGKSLPFSSKEFADAWQRWLEYRKNVIKKPYKNEDNQLKQLSVFDEEFCIDLIDRAIANEHQGLVFANTMSDFLKYQKNGKTTTSTINGHGKSSANNGTDFTAFL